MGTEKHKHAAPKNVKCAVITVSDTRTIQDDISGKLIVDLLETAGHKIVHRSIVKDERELIEKELYSTDADVCLFNGGTGISSRDVTADLLTDSMERKLPGFGELFRYLSYREIGSAALMSRACAGVMDSKIVFALPGSPNAVRLALEKLIIPELGHLIYEVNR